MNTHTTFKNNDNPPGFMARMGKVIGPTSDCDQPKVTLIFMCHQPHGADGTKEKRICTTATVTMNALSHMIETEQLPRGINKAAATTMLNRLRKRSQTTAVEKNCSVSERFYKLGRICQGRKGSEKRIELIAFKQSISPRTGKKTLARVKTEKLNLRDLMVMIETGKFPEGITKRSAWEGINRLKTSMQKMD